MRIAICTNLTGGVGLKREAELLCEFLLSLGHSTFTVQYDDPVVREYGPADLMISLETVARQHQHIAPIHWWFPNPEWVTIDLIGVADRIFQKIFTKTREAQGILEPLFPDRVFYTGFLVRDQFDATVPRQRKFLHIGGNGSLRNTDAVVDAWRWTKEGKGIDADLVIISTAYKNESLPGRVTVIPRATEDDLKFHQNSSLFHLYPSATEGFGHALREAQSCGAILLTTDASPMDEVEADYMVPSIDTGKFNLATTHEVNAIDIHAAAQDMLHVKDLVWRSSGRDLWAKANERFRETFEQHIKAVDPSKPVPKWKRALDGVKSIAFLGNFGAPFSTENELAWSFEYDGHEVIRLQENTIGLRGMEQALQADLFLWVKTPGFLKLYDQQMFMFLDRLRAHGVPSASFHLDKFFGIPERQVLIGVHPFWRTDYVFTADGGYQSAFANKGVNHTWLPPAVVLRGCYPGTPDPALSIDVGFVGATAGYHDIYPERQTLIAFLQKSFGNRFRIFTGYRELALNNLYASIKVVVGDSIFANQPPGNQQYWSDRVPETMGRGGVLVHPWVEGIEMMGEGLVTHQPGDFDDLGSQIERLLLHPLLRRDCRDTSMDLVRRRHTYSNRVRTILDYIFERNETA